MLASYISARLRIQHATMMGVGWMMMSVVLSLLLDVSSRKVSVELDILQVSEMRSVIALLLLTPIVALRGGLRPLRTERLGTHVLRGVVLYSGQLAWLLGLTLIPLAQATAIEFTAPIWAALLAAIYLEEPLTRVKWTAMLIGLLGVAFIVDPRAETFNAGHAIVLVAALLFGATIVTTRLLARHDSAFTIVVHMLVIQSVIGLVPAVSVWYPPPIDLWPWIMLSSVAGTASQYCLAQALRHAAAIVVAPIDYFRVPFSALLGYLFFSESVGLQTMCGAILVIAGNLLNLRRRSSPPSSTH